MILHAFTDDVFMQWGWSLCKTGWLLVGMRRAPGGGTALFDIESARCVHAVTLSLPYYGTHEHMNIHVEQRLIRHTHTSL